jgi:hypothetical protein
VTAPELLTTVRRHNLGHDPRRLPGAETKPDVPNHNLGTFGRVVSSSASFGGPHEVPTRAADLVGAMDHLLALDQREKSAIGVFLRVAASAVVANNRRSPWRQALRRRVPNLGVARRARRGARRRAMRSCSSAGRKTRGDHADRAAAQPRGGRHTRTAPATELAPVVVVVELLPELTVVDLVSDGGHRKHGARHRGRSSGQVARLGQASWRSSGSARIGSHPEGRAPRSARRARPWRIGPCRWSEPR